jgi:hypothetical protein
MVPDPLEAFYALSQRPAWMTDAACWGHTDLFYGPEGTDSRAAYDMVKQAKAIGIRCTVRTECTGAGRQERFGIWGGLTGTERRVARRRERAA